MTKVTYFPILKAKQGELAALAESNPNVAFFNPVVEISPWERDEGDLAQELLEVAKAISRIEKAWTGKRETLFLDTTAAEPDPEDGWSEATPVLSQFLRSLRSKSVSVGPVVRITAATEYIRALSQALTPNDHMIIRITSDDLDETSAPLRDLAVRISDITGVHASNTHLMLDFGEIRDEKVLANSARLAQFIFPQLDDGRWRSLIVASGSFPVNLSEVAPYTVSRLHRFDADLWREVRKLGLSSQPHYSDYAVTHPVLPVGGAFAAPPQLRYALGTEWLVSKGRRNDRKGHKQFFDICDVILSEAGSRAAPRDASWGDFRIHAARDMARGESATAVGPGNASTWRAISTSHHLTEVLRRLSETGEP